MSYQPVREAVLPAAAAGVSERLAFIRKVYGLMFLGVGFFFLSAALPIFGYAAEIPVLSEVFMLAYALPWWVAIIMFIGAFIACRCVINVPGLNLLAFFAFAGVYGFFSITLLSAALSVGGMAIIMKALGLTTLVMGGLSAYVFISRKDFSFLGGFLWMGLIMGFVVIIGMVIASLMGVDIRMLDLAISMFFCLLMCGYILYDTSNILHHFPTTAVVPAALELMLDFIILFRNILYIFMSRD